MKILFLIAYPTIGGPLPKILPILLEQLESLGCVIQQAFWSRHSDHESFWEKIVGRFRDLRYVVRQLRTVPVDVMVITTTHDWMALLRDLPLLLVARPLARRIVVQFHGSHSEVFAAAGHLLMKAFTRQILKRVDAVLLLSREEVRDWQTFYPRTKYYLVQNPYVSQNATRRDRDAIRPLATGECPQLLFVGRLVEEKGIFDLLDAIEIVRTHTEFLLVIAGVGEDGKQLATRIQTTGLQSQVSLIGYRQGRDLIDIYESADLFVFPSWREGFPLVLVEAMDFGLPIVTTYIRGAADHLHDGINAVFVPPRNPAALAKAILNLLADRELCRRMGNANREKVKDFAPETVGRHYLSVLEEVVGPRS